MNQRDDILPLCRTRLAVALTSLAVAGLELCLMRTLSVRFWHHFAAMVIGVALLGYGASGTALALLQRPVLRRHRAWVCGLALAFALSVPATYLAGQRLRFHAEFLVWLRGVELLGFLALQVLMLVPFLLAGMVVGAVLLDRPEHRSGHYAASLIGSGVGSIVCVLLMRVLRADTLLMAMAAAGAAAGMLLIRWRRPAAVGAAAGIGLVIIMAATSWLPQWPAMSEYKTLSLARAMPGTTTIYQAEGPLGRMDVLDAPGVHMNPGLSLLYEKPLPQHELLIVDGDLTSAIYDCRKAEDWGFLDYTTRAAAYHVGPHERALIIGAGGGEEIGLALDQRCRDIVALEMNPQVIAAMIGPLADRGGAIYRQPGVHVLCREARGYLASTTREFDVIQLPPVDAMGASGAGLYGAQESYLYTVEAFGAMLDHLSANGVLCVTRWARTPPRDDVRAFEIARTALQERGLNPRRHLAMIRNYMAVTVLAFRAAISPAASENLRAFCRDRAFDLCYLPDVAESEVNRFHELDRPYYFDAARALLGAEREAFVRGYIFDLSASTDDKPYYFHFFRWRATPVLLRQLRGQAPAFLEIGYVMLGAALAQAALLSFLLILLPLVPRLGGLRGIRGKRGIFSYFLLIGLGFMLLEMGFLQKLILYLAQPIYSAAVVIASALICAGIGSCLSRAWGASFRRVAAVAASAVAIVTLIYVLGLDQALKLTQGQPAWLRFAIATILVGIPSLAMGHMFPAALQEIAESSPALIPWAWAINGCASVIATAAAPLLAIEIGFSRVLLAAAGCYLAAGLLFARRMKGARPYDVFSPGKALPTPEP
jgi:hypothetical protein